jgi:cobalt-zinc-cadmium efflux system membrane fusion protein
LILFLVTSCGPEHRQTETSELAGSDTAAGSAVAPASEGAEPSLEASREPEWLGSEGIVLTAEEMEAVDMKMAPVEYRSLSARLPAMGRVLEDQYRKAIVSYPFSARVASIEARVGSWVEEGDTLVVLQSEEVGEAVSGFYKAMADHELAQVDFQRQEQLYENGVGARKDFSTAEAGLQVAEASLNAAEKKLHVLGFTEAQIELLRDTHQVSPLIPLLAPISGKVVINNTVLGEMVDESTEILTLLDPTRLWVEAAIYEKDIARIRAGQKVEVTVPAYPQETFQGTITYISDILDPKTRTITVRTEVPNPELKLKPGMFADLTIELNHNGTALSVPAEAVLDDGGWPMVFVSAEDRRFEPRRVTLGSRSDGFVEIAGGLSPGEAVVTRGNFQLKSKLYETVLEAGHIH